MHSSIIADPVLVLTFFLLSLVLLHFILIHGCKLNKLQWKYADYVWIFLSTIGLIATAAQVRIAMADGLLSDLTHRIKPESKVLQMELQGSDGFCQPMVRGDFPPSDWDAIAARRKLVCDWLKGLILNLPKSVPIQENSEAEPDFPKLAMAAPPKIQDAIFQKTINEISDAFSEYNNLQEEREALLKEHKRNSLEEVIYFFGPLLISLGFAIRFTKTTGEIRIEKDANKPDPNLSTNDAKKPSNFSHHCRLASQKHRDRRQLSRWPREASGVQRQRSRYQIVEQP